MATFYMLGATGGLIILHASQIQTKNVSSVLIANLLSIGIATIAYWACGFAFAIGDGTRNASNFFLSHTRFFLMNATEAEYMECANNVVILAFVVVIINSGFISRMRCWIYPVLITLIGGFLYPCVYHWINAEDGWLRSGILVRDVVLKYQDYFGCGYIHVYAGSTALFASIFIGPRKEQREKRQGRGKLLSLGGNITPLIVLGGVLALVGLIAKNSIHPTTKVTSAQALFNNFLAAQSSAVVAFILKRGRYLGDPAATKGLVNGALAGVVSVSCAAHDYHPYGAFVIGVVAGITYVLWSALCSVCLVDDPTESVAVHFGAGLWAVIAGPLFNKSTGIIYTGSIYSMETLGWHILAEVAIFVWAGITLLIIFLPFIRCASYGLKEIAKGLDQLEQHGPAFPEKNVFLQDAATESEMGYDNDFDIVSLQKDGVYTLGTRATFNGNATFHSDSTLTRDHAWDYSPNHQWQQANY